MENTLKRTYPSNAQKTRLIELIQGDDELRNGKFSATFTKKVAEGRWKTIAAEVNSIPGAKKTWLKWRKAWHDLKAKKKKNSMLKRLASGTGGGRPSAPPSEEELIILSTISESSLTRDPNVQESLVPFIDLGPSDSKKKKEMNLAGSASSIPSERPLPGCSKITVNYSIDFVSSESDEASDVTPKKNTSHQQGTSRIAAADPLPGCSKTGRSRIDTKTQNNKKKPVAARRLERSLIIAEKLQKTMKEKNQILKDYYDASLQEMRKQTAILQQIADNTKL